jgi:ABC-type sugar transport system ATPase subunit
MSNGTRTSPEALCSVSGIKKSYGGVKALVGVDLEVYPNQVQAVVGENGAGKSTLMKIIAGAEQPDEGRIYINGQETRLASVKQANAQGIAIVFQELSLYPELDTLANLFLQREPLRFGIIQRNAMRQRAEPILEDLGLHIDLSRPVGSLKLGEQQLVEIAKALLADSRVLILDEPNSALNAAETERLFKIIRWLRQRGVAIIYVSHRLEEVFEIADVITIMRNARIVETVRPGDVTIPQVVSLMIGRASTDYVNERVYHPREGASLELQNVTVEGEVADVSLQARPGEVVGLAGLEGSGAGTVLDVIFGIRSAKHGSVILPNGRKGPRNIPDAVHMNIAMVPCDRRQEGLMLEQDVETNISQVTAAVLGRLGFFLRRNMMRQNAQARAEALQIQMSSLTMPVSNLSGGNQQKVVIAKWLEANPQVVLLNDPTRGVDVGAKEEIYRVVQSLADEGRIVLFTSTELTEFVHLCDRVIVFYRGKVVGQLLREDLTTQRLLEAINTGEV